MIGLVAGLSEKVAILLRCVDLVLRTSVVDPLGQVRHQRRGSPSDGSKVLLGDDIGHRISLEAPWDGAKALINRLIILFALSFRHAFRRNPVNSNSSGCRITSGMTVLFCDS